MCVIVHLPKNKAIKKKVLQNCYENNPDGWGIMAPMNDKLVISKGLGNFEAFYNELQQFPQNAPRAIHFRWKTHGLVSTENCHPFEIGNGAAVMHNGIIKIEETNKEMSDTWHFVELELRPFIEKNPDALAEAERFSKLVEQHTAGSRLLFMDHLGRTVKTALNSWHKEFGVYFSNSHSHKESYKRGTYGANYDDYGYSSGYGYGYGSSKVYSDAKPYGREIDQDTGHEYEPFDLQPPTIDQIYDMSEGDLVDWADDHPEDAAELIRDLLGVKEAEEAIAAREKAAEVAKEDKRVNEAVAALVGSTATSSGGTV